MGDDATEQELARLGGVVGERARSEGRTIAVAESLTSGLLSNALARSEGARDWFRGGVVAYARDGLANSAGAVTLEPTAGPATTAGPRP
jgi:nicotinamide-nucleotide amidase